VKIGIEERQMFRRRSSEHKRRRDANIQSRQPSMMESLKRGRGSRITCESDVEDEYGNECLVSTLATLQAPLLCLRLCKQEQT
jgi:hypothetical protein